jgi:O-antigen/teichoic acid export membrane protein
MLGKLVAYGAGLGAAAVLAVILAGRQILQLAYGSLYASYAGLFCWLMTAGAVAGVAILLLAAITATRAFRIQVLILAIVCASNFAACWWLVPLYGLKGGAIAMLASSLILVVLGVGTLAFLLRDAGSEPASAAAFLPRVELRS